jgi:hypothetical protein
VAHSGDGMEAGVRQLGGQGLSVSRRPQGVGGAVDDHGRGGDRGEWYLAVGGHDAAGQVVVEGRGRVLGAAVGPFDEVAGGRFIKGEDGAVEDPPGLQVGGLALVRGGGRGHGQLRDVGQELLGRWRQVGRVGVLAGQGAGPGRAGAVPHRAAHDRGEGQDPVGVMDGQELGDGAAQRGADDVGGRDLVAVETARVSAVMSVRVYGWRSKSTTLDWPASR